MSYEKKVKVVLHGYLKDLYPHDIITTGYSVEEIMNGLGKQIKELRPSLTQDKHVISVVGYETEQDLKGPLKPDQKELHIVPAMAGNKKGGFIQVALGVAFIALALWNPAGWAIGALTIEASMVFGMGVSLVLGGLLQVLSPAPKMDTGSTTQDPEASKYLGANQNTTRIGTRIPLAYGRCRLFGHYISFDIDAKDVAL